MPSSDIVVGYLYEKTSDPFFSNQNASTVHIFLRCQQQVQDAKDREQVAHKATLTLCGELWRVGLDLPHDGKETNGQEWAGDNATYKGDMLTSFLGQETLRFGFMRVRVC